VARKSAKSIRWARETRAIHLADVLTVTEAARYLGIGRNAAYEAVRRGEIPSVKFGPRCIRVPRAGLQRMLEGSGGAGADG